ncbi:MAG: heavy metal-binding domain-containing protein [Planctomycetaceae bacterium]|nr:heavy metal-binding domain-containing protein [Planctomycetaceae bacterium]
MSRLSRVRKQLRLRLFDLEEIYEYGKLLAESREQTLDRMVTEAESLGGNAIVNVRIATSMVIQGSAEMLTYGTTVILKD